MKRKVTIMNEFVKLLLLKNQMIMMTREAPFQPANIIIYGLQVQEILKETSLGKASIESHKLGTLSQQGRGGPTL